ncbi:unnamed protein product [Musa hybrid cultivar]
MFWDRLVVCITQELHQPSLTFIWIEGSSTSVYSNFLFLFSFLSCFRITTLSLSLCLSFSVCCFLDYCQDFDEGLHHMKGFSAYFIWIVLFFGNILDIITS